MPKVSLPIVLSFVLVGLVAILSFQVTPVKSAAAGHVVISEVMVRTVASASDEFVELYNPTGSAVDLSGWMLRRKSEAGNFQANLVSSMSGTIPANGYFLLTSDSSTSSGSADLQFTDGIASNNTLLLYSDAGTTLVDKLGLGAATDSEATPAAMPGSDQSTERKANSSSTIASMMIGGLDELLGNAEDTDNNGDDFLTRELPQPQNTSSTLEPVAGPTPSPSADVSPSPSASVEPSPSASVEPSPSIEPSASPSPSVSPSASVEPSPSVSPSPEVSASPSVSPSVSPSASPFVFRTFTLQCEVTYREIRTPFFNLRLPRISCGWIPS